MDEDQPDNDQKHPSVEVFAATAAKEDELLECGARATEIMRTEKDPGNAYGVDRNRPCKPAHRSRGPLQTLGKSDPLAMNEQRGSM